MNKLFYVGFGALVTLVVCSFATESKPVFSGLAGLIRLTPPPGTVLAFAGDTVPDGYLECDGRSLSKADYPELFKAIKNVYGGDPAGTTFNLPDCRSRTVVGAGQGDGTDDEMRPLSDRKLGIKFGSEKHRLTPDEMPKHNHNVGDEGHAHSLTGGAWGNGYGAAYTRGGIPFNPLITKTELARANIHEEDRGGDQPSPIIQPSIALRYIIKF